MAHTRTRISKREKELQDIRFAGIKWLGHQAVAHPDQLIHLPPEYLPAYTARSKKDFVFMMENAERRIVVYTGGQMPAYFHWEPDETGCVLLSLEVHHRKEDPPATST